MNLRTASSTKISLSSFKKGQPIVLSTRGSQSFRKLPCTRTKSAICFLCLFDGLRIPSIRRLIRKPRTFGNLPLRYFDPSFSSPEGEEYLSKIYTQIFTGKCDCIVDPSVATVTQLIKAHCGQANNQRVILHYFGYGVHHPTDKSTIFFFDDDNKNYKGCKIDNFLLFTQSNPLLLIFDCDYSGLLLKLIEVAKESQKQDIIAFFSCADKEPLPSSTDNPLDLFSLCLIDSYKTSLWWYKKKHSNIFAKVQTKHLKDNQFLISFFDAILSAIANSEIPKDQYSLLFQKDPTVSKICKGFFLAQHIFKYFHITPASIPTLPDVSSHILWEIYEMALDLATNDPTSLEKSIFHLLVTSYSHYHSASTLPLFSFFITVPDFHTPTSQCLLDDIDKSDKPDISLLNYFDLYSAIVQYKNPSSESLLLLSKLITLTNHFPVDSQLSVFSNSSDIECLKSGMLCVSIAIIKQCQDSFYRIAQICKNYAQSCAPYSCILYGLLSEKTGTLSNISGAFTLFLPMLDENKPVEDQASAVFAVSYSKSDSVIEPVMKCTESPHWLVRNEAVLALAKLFNLGIGNKNDIIDRYEKLKDDESEVVRKNVLNLLPQIQRIDTANYSCECDISEMNKLDVPESELLSLLCKSVEMPHFKERYQTSIFEGLL